MGGKSLAADRRWEKERKIGHTVTIDDDFAVSGQERNRLGVSIN